MFCSLGWTGQCNEQAGPPFPSLACRTWRMSEVRPHWFPIGKIIAQAIQLAMRKITHLCGYTIEGCAENAHSTAHYQKSPSNIRLSLLPHYAKELRPSHPGSVRTETTYCNESEYCYPSLKEKREREAETYELPLLRRIHYQEASKENGTGLCHLFLLNVQTYLQPTRLSLSSTILRFRQISFS